MRDINTDADARLPSIVCTRLHSASGTAALFQTCGFNQRQVLILILCSCLKALRSASSAPQNLETFFFLIWKSPPESRAAPLRSQQPVRTWKLHYPPPERSSLPPHGISVDEHFVTLLGMLAATRSLTMAVFWTSKYGRWNVQKISFGLSLRLIIIVMIQLKKGATVINRLILAEVTLKAGCTRQTSSPRLCCSVTDPDEQSVDFLLMSQRVFVD